MSSTRHASEGSPLRQERFASSPAYEKPLLGNLVAKRCRAIADPADRALVYWIQQCSHQEGGLTKFAEDFLAAFPERIGSAEMHRIGKKPTDHYSEDEVQTIGLRKRRKLSSADFLPRGAHDNDDECWMVNDDDSAAPPTPINVPASELFDYCQRHSGELPSILADMCLDPQQRLSGSNALSVWWFDDLIGALHTHRSSYIDKTREAFADTTISTQIFDDLDYAHYSKKLVVIEGLQRTGKTTAAKAWCDMHPGQAVYVPLESGRDLFTFYRCIARAIGTASSGQMKTVELRIKIEDMLQEKHLMLVFDESQFAWPMVDRPKGAPDRIDWLRTSLVDHDVPVALVSTPQFEDQCTRFEKCLGWNAAQIRGRVKLHRILPPELPEKDLKAVAQKMAPHASESSLLRLVAFAQASDDYLAGIERLTVRAAFFAARDGRNTSDREDIKRALDEAMPRVIESAQAAALPTRPRKRTARVLPLRHKRATGADTFSPAAARRASLELSASAEAEPGASKRLHFAEAATSD